jgi:hypothetical protein
LEQTSGSLAFVVDGLANPSTNDVKLLLIFEIPKPRSKS